MMEMIAFDTGDPNRINHFIKVHSLARTIAIAENANTKAQIIIEASALVHDIGIYLQNASTVIVMKSFKNKRVENMLVLS